MTPTAPVASSSGDRAAGRAPGVAVYGAGRPSGDARPRVTRGVRPVGTPRQPTEGTAPAWRSRSATKAPTSSSRTTTAGPCGSPTSGARRTWSCSSTPSPSPACARASCASCATTCRSSPTATTQLLAVSNDSIHTLRVFAEQEGLEYPLLADFWPHGEVARAYGVFDEDKGCAVRGTFVIDKAGVVRWTVVNALPDARDLERVRQGARHL